MYFDDVAQMLIKQWFLKERVSSEVHHRTNPNNNVITILENELEIKNQLINKQQQVIKELVAIIKKRSESTSGKNKRLIDGRATPNIISTPIDRLLINAIESLENAIGESSTTNKINTHHKATLH